MRIAVSYLKSNKSIEDTILEINKTSCDYLHVDLIDGEFCGEKNYDLDELISVLSFASKPLDIHLMVLNPSILIERLVILNPAFITIHIEIKTPEKYLKQIQGLGVSAGLAINPKTDISLLEPYLKETDLILVMSVEPGRGGQEFIDDTPNKLHQIKKLCQKNKSQCLLSCDGGINSQTIIKIKNEVDIVVSGSYICLKDDYEEAIKSLK